MGELTALTIHIYIYTYVYLNLSLCDKKITPANSSQSLHQWGRKSDEDTGQRLPGKTLEVEDLLWFSKVENPKTLPSDLLHLHWPCREYSHHRLLKAKKPETGRMTTTPLPPPPPPPPPQDSGPSKESQLDTKLIIHYPEASEVPQVHRCVFMRFMSSLLKPLHSSPVK